MDPSQFTFSMGTALNATNASNYAHNFACAPHHGNLPNNPPAHANPSSTPYQLMIISNRPPPPATPTASFLRKLFMAIDRRNPNLPRLPTEIEERIISMAIDLTNPPGSIAPSKRSPPAMHPALRPPSSGMSPFMALPAELRRKIFAGSLTDRLVAIQPACDGSESCTKSKQKDKDLKLNSFAHNVPNLMTLCKKICGEIGEVMYEERTFVIHVHEGLFSGGVEILNAGRQPLQYQASSEDQRFEKFGPGEVFGLRRMKKIVIQIHPTTEDHDRHLALNTHFMNLALCRLLERPTNDKERITSIEIEFVAKATPPTDRSTRTAIWRHEKPWMDVNGPKETSIHNVSDIELLLRPFAMLTRCHRASIELPSYLASEPQLAAFVANLEHSMMSEAGTLMPSDNLEYKVEQLREDMEGHVVNLLYGNGNRVDVAKLNDEETVQAVSDNYYEDSESDKGLPLPFSKNTRGSKHPRSKSDAAQASSDAKRTKKEQKNGDRKQRKQLTDMVKQSLKDAGRKRTAKEISTLVDDLMDGETTQLRAAPSSKTMGTVKRRQSTKTQAQSSLLDDSELAEMDEELQTDLAIQLSMGKSRKELGLREMPTDIESEDVFRANVENEHDWKRELGFGSANHPRDTKATHREEIRDLDEDVTDETGLEEGELPARTAAASSGLARYAEMSSKLQAKLGDTYRSAPMPADVANPLARQPSTFSNGYSWSSVPATQNPLAARPAKTPRKSLQAEDSGIGMLSSDDNVPKLTQNVGEVTGQLEDPEMMETYVDFEGT